MSAPTPAVPVRVDVLGPLALHVDSAVVDVPGKRRRAVLATLALARGRVVTAERLVDTLWPDSPPEDAAQALYNHASRLRRHLGPAAGRLRRVGGGYVLDLADDELDATLARHLAARVDLASPEEAIVRAREAVALWRGPALQEFRHLPAMEVESVGLDELRLRLRDDLTEALVLLGDTGAAAEAASAATAQPLRERSALLLMRALASEGRSAEAMAAGAAYRQALAEETGLDPGPSLAALEQDIAKGGIATGPAPSGSFGPRPLARPSGPFVGRQQDREEIMRLLRDHRAVTVTGPGGVGKTRLALDVAAELSEDGGAPVRVVDLAAVEEASRVCQSVASTLGLRTAGDVAPGDVAAALGDNRLLLVLDNCEHVAQACRDLVTTLDARSPGVRVLATSRVTLHAPGEYVVRIQPLPVPTTTTGLDHAERQASVRAFVEHARRRHHEFRLDPDDLPPLMDVLRHLDGLPLAIELAAGQAAMMPIPAVRDRLGRALDLHTGASGPEDERQRTLRLTIQWSYALLGQAEQALLRSMAPFLGGVDLSGVETLAADVVPGTDPLPVLQRLVDASLVVVDPTLTRYRLLFTVRAFLLDELAGNGELLEAEERFLTWACDTAAELGDALFSPDEGAADRRLRAELANLRAARDLARRHDRLDACIDITVATTEASIWRDLRELWAWGLELADEPVLVGHPREVEVVAGAAESARLIGSFDRCTALAERALRIEPPPGDAARATARCWSALAAVAHFRGDFARASELWGRAGAAEDPRRYAGYLTSAALSAGYGGDASRAVMLLAQARDADALHPCASPRAFTDYVEGELVAVEDPAAAIPLYLSAIEGARTVGANFVDGVASVALASARTRTGEHAAAAEMFGHLLGYWSATGHGPQLWTTARNAVPLLLAHDRTREAALLLLHADRAPNAAAVNEQIARHSGRAFTSLDELLEPTRLDALRAEAATMTPGEVIELARTALARIATAG